jgi:uncharacterized protein YqeY
MKEKELKLELRAAMKAKDAERCNAIKMVLGEIPRLNKKKDEKVTEEDINKIITKLIKSEIVMLEYSGLDESKSEYLNTLKGFLPKMMSEKEIEEWILDKIDLSAYNNPMQAMKSIMKELKGKADGNVVRNVLTRSE